MRVCDSRFTLRPSIWSHLVSGAFNCLTFQSLSYFVRCPLILVSAHPVGWVRKKGSSRETVQIQEYLSIAAKSLAATAYAVREGREHRFLAVDQNTNETFKAILISLSVTKLPVMVQVIQPYPISFVGNMRLKSNRIYISVPKSLRNIHEALWHDGRTFPIIITPLTATMVHVR